LIHFSFEVYTVSYGTRGGSGYGGHSRKGSGSHRFSGKDAQEIQAQRSFQAKLMDSSRRAPMAKSFEEWASKPNRLDLPDVDAPSNEAAHINKDSKSEFIVYQGKHKHWTQVIIENMPDGRCNKIVMEFGKEKSHKILTEAEKKEAFDSLHYLEKIGAGTVTKTDNLAALRQVVGSVNTPDNPEAVYTEADKRKDEALKPSSKQPWEMTYSEFFDAAGSEYTAGDRFGLVYHGRVPSYLKEVEGKTIWVGEQGATPEERIHRAVIRQALSRGKTVPAEVLKQYPDLAKPTPAAKTEVVQAPKQTKRDATPLVYRASIGHYGGMYVYVPENRLGEFKAMFPQGVFPRNIEVKKVSDSWTQQGVEHWHSKYPNSDRVAIVHFANASKGEKFLEDNVTLPFTD
jgi:hypothetical protein